MISICRRFVNCDVCRKLRIKGDPLDPREPREPKLNVSINGVKSYGNQTSYVNEMH